VKNCLRRHGISPTLHYTLSDLGIRKRYHAEFDIGDAARVFERVRSDLRSNEDDDRVVSAQAAGTCSGAARTSPALCGRRLPES
jgi:hypothetical protein